MASQLYKPEWRDRSIIASKPIEEIAAFIKWTITYYKEKHWKDYDLWEGFLDDYCSFTLETFRNCDINTIKDIREHLRQNGVYVRKSRGIEVAKILLELLQEDEPAQWPANDSSQTITPVIITPTTTIPATTTPAVTISTTNDLPQTTTLATTTPVITILAITTSTTDGLLKTTILAAITSTITTPVPASAPTLPLSPKITEKTSQLTLQSQDYSRQITILSKLYTDEIKYSGQKDNFDIGLKSNFGEEEYKRDILDEWNSIKLTDGSEKALDALLNRMWHLQCGLYMDLFKEDEGLLPKAYYCIAGD